MKTAEVCRKHGFSEAVLQLEGQVRRAREVHRCQAPEGTGGSGNARLKKLLADAMLDNTALKDLLAKNVWSAPSVQGSWT
jgi:putative transposase